MWLFSLRSLLRLLLRLLLLLLLLLLLVVSLHPTVAPVVLVSSDQIISDAKKGLYIPTGPRKISEAAKVRARLQQQQQQ